MDISPLNSRTNEELATLRATPPYPHRRRGAHPLWPPLEQAQPHLFMVTINGADTGGTNWQQLIQPLGSGTYDPCIVLRKLQQLAYTGPVAFQGFGIGGDRREILTKTMQAWQTLSGQTAK